MKNNLSLLFFLVLLPPICSAAPPIKIGVLADLSGSNASNGQDCRNGIDVAKAQFLKDGRAGTYSIDIKVGDHLGEREVKYDVIGQIIKNGEPVDLR
jgi:ABC-type branched-subunit amino acid transport system substrate-binding protein